MPTIAPVVEYGFVDGPEEPLSLALEGGAVQLVEWIVRISSVAFSANTH